MKVFRALLFAPLVAVGLACAPSFHAIHEGNVRFEHCYALEENPQSGMQNKADCWRDWSEHYTYGQTRDRIQYATARYVALTAAPNVPTDEALMMAAPGENRVTTITAPAPTNAFAPPPKVLDPVEGGAPQLVPTPRPSEHNPIVLGTSPDAGGGASPATPALPASSCSEGCATAYRDCGGGGCASIMGNDAGTRDKEKAKTCVVCERTYKTCMRGCFK